jgi:hypothetical protein
MTYTQMEDAIDELTAEVGRLREACREAEASEERLRTAIRRAVRLILEADATTEEANYAQATAEIRLVLCRALALSAGEPDGGEQQR